MYQVFQLIKSRSSLTRKHGFITRKEVQRIADSNKESKSNFLRKLDKLVDAGYIVKNKWGFQLTSWKTINNNLKLYKYKKDTNGELTKKTYTPFVKAVLPETNDVKVIEVIMMYLLIVQIHNQYQFRANGSKRDKRKLRPKFPENFALSADKICQRGNYNSKMEVWRLLNFLENVGLADIDRGAKVAGSYNECSTITLYPLYKASWNNLYKSRRAPSLRQQIESIPKPVKTKRVLLKPSEKKVKKVVEYSSVENLLYKCLNAGMQDILVDEDVLSYAYKTKAGKRRKVIKSQFSEILVHVLNDKDLRNILMTVFKPENFLITEKEGSYFDSNPDTFAKDRYKFFKYHHVQLVEAGGNFEIGNFFYSRSDRRNEIAFRLAKGPFFAPYVYKDGIYQYYYDSLDYERIIEELSKLSL